MTRLAVTLTVEELRELVRVEVAAALDAQQPPSDWADQEGIAAHLGVSSPTVKKLTENGMPHVYVGSHRRFSRRAVDAWLAEQKEPTK